MQQSLIGLAPRRKATQFMPSVRHIDFSTLVSELLKPGFCPENNVRFTECLNNAAINPEILNVTLRVNGKSFEATRTEEGLFIDGNQTVEGDTTAIDIDPDGKDLNIVVRGDLPRNFAETHRIQWYVATDREGVIVPFKQSKGACVATAIGIAKQQALLFIIEAD